MTRVCRCGLPLDPPGSAAYWVPSRDPEPGPDVQAVALCHRDPAILRHERTLGGWRSDGAAAIYPEHTPPKPWRWVGRCWAGREHPVRDVTALLQGTQAPASGVVRPVRLAERARQDPAAPARFVGDEHKAAREEVTTTWTR